MVRITKPRNVEKKVSLTRTLVGIIQAMQNVHQMTYIKTFDDLQEEKYILNADQVPPNDTGLEAYLKLAPNITHNRMIFKIMVASRHRLLDYKKDTQFCKWLNMEHIGLEEVHLNSLDPVNIGYFEEMVPDPETLSLHTKRLRRYLPKGHPRFQLLPKMLYDSNHRAVKVIMAKCDEENFEKLEEMFMDLNSDQIITFFPWKEFTGMGTELRDSCCSVLVAGW
jgi:hypothetical protein